ncbi:MAG: glycosyltransferase family 4 protein [Verrucomicrobiota bacterium]
MSPAPKLAVVVSHPIQYYAPWFQHIVRSGAADLRVFYLWNFGVTEQRDAGFGRAIKWDLPLLEGYASEFVPTSSRRPGTDRFFGLRNPTLASRVAAWAPDAVLIFGYGHAALLRFILTWHRHSQAPLLFRGDSHLLGRRPPRLRDRIRNLVTRHAFSRCAAFLATGKANRDFFLSHDVPAPRIFAVPHCVDNARFSHNLAATRAQGRAWRAELGIPPSHRVILFAGKLEPKKRPDLLLSAFLASPPPETTLLLVGHGPLESSLHVRAAGKTEVAFAPFQNQAAMPRTYAAADVFVLPSEGHQETWGLAVNEAMAAGVPSIVSDHVGCHADLVTEGETGWVFPAGDAAALGRKLHLALATLADPAQAALLQTNLALRIAQYSYDAATAGLHTALRETPASSH